MIRAFAVLALLAIATPALAVDPTPVKTPTVSDPNKIRCKRETPIGSLVATQKECHTEAEWHQIAEQARANTQTMQSAASAGGAGH